MVLFFSGWFVRALRCSMWLGCSSEGSWETWAVFTGSLLGLVVQCVRMLRDGFVRGLGSSMLFWDYSMQLVGRPCLVWNLSGGCRQDMAKLYFHLLGSSSPKQFSCSGCPREHSGIQQSDSVPTA